MLVAWVLSVGVMVEALTISKLTGVAGGFGYTPKYLREQIHELKDALVDKKAPFGVDLLLPAVGGNARKTNKDCALLMSCVRSEDREVLTPHVRHGRKARRAGRYLH